MLVLGILFVVFVVGFFLLFALNRARERQRNQRVTHDTQGLRQRLQISEAWQTRKFGPESLRHAQRRVQIEPYADVETYELRDLYRENGLR